MDLDIILFHYPVLENVVFDEHTRVVDYFDKSVTGMYIYNYINNEFLKLYIYIYSHTYHLLILSF